MKKTRAILLIVFILSIGLRLVLAYLTREANDNHMEVISWIADKHQLPDKNDCWECFQPKFFYSISAGIITLFDVQTPEHRIMAIQFFNVLLGFFTIFLFWKFIKKQSFGEITKILLFSFFAFNPSLVGINIQSTNDTMEIFFGVMAIYYCDSFFKSTKIIDFVLLLVALLAAALTKATGILLFIVIAVFFIFKIFSQPERYQKLRLAKFFASSILCFFFIVLFAGGYYTYFKKYNSLPSSVWNKDPAPFFFKDSYIARPGVMNMATGFFTFRYFDMIRQPYINNECDNYPLHRTSLWSQLYGRTVFLQFDQWPPAWQTHAPVVIFVGRVLIALGIVPLFLFLWGFGRGIIDFVKNILKKGSAYLAEENNYLHIGVTVALFSVIVKYCHDYRDFSAMKSIYIFPGFISYIKLFMDGYESVKGFLLKRLINIVLIIMVVFSILDIGHLIYQLQYRF